MIKDSFTDFLCMKLMIKRIARLLFFNELQLRSGRVASKRSNEVANGNGYTTGGVTLANASVIENGTSGCFDSDDPEWTSATFTARGALIYNDTDGDRAIAVLDFGGDFSVAGGTFKIVFPAQTANTAIVRIDQYDFYLCK